MTIDDDGTKVTILSKAGFFVRLFAVTFLALACLYPIFVVLALVMPPEMARFDCDRARASCTFTRGHWTRTVPLAEIASVEVVHDKGAKNRSASDFVRIKLTSGQTFDASDSSYHDEVTRGMRGAVEALNQFLADSAKPTFTTDFRAGDNDWVVMIMFSFVCPAMAWIFVRMWQERRVEIDRDARAVRLVVRRRFGKDQTFDIPFSDVQRISAWGARWLRVELVTGGQGRVTLVVAPRSGPWLADLRRTLGLLAGITGAPFADDAASVVGVARA